MTATTTTARIDPQTQEELMRQAGIWIEHSTLIEDDLPARPLAAVQAEKHQLDRYTQLVADRAAARDSKCLAQIEEPAALAGTTIEQYARMFNAACEALGQVSDCLGINSDIDPGAEPIIAAIEQLRAGKTHPVLDDNWKARMLDGRAPERDEMGLGDHPELPWLDEGMMPRSFFAALGLELAHTSAEDQLDGDVLGAMSEAVNWTDWQPNPPTGDGWKLVSIFDTEDGPVAWWLRELPEAEDGTTSIRNLQAEVESLRAERDEADRRAGAAERSAAAFHEDHQRFEQVRRRMKEQWGVDDRVSFDVVWQQALDAKQALAKLEARKPLPLSDEQIDAIADGMPGGLGGFLKTWGWRQFARKILDLRAPPTWEPQFDCMAPGQEELAIQFCAEIAGPRGQPGRNPDPVRLLEMAEALYKAEADARGITGGSS